MFDDEPVGHCMSRVAFSTWIPVLSLALAAWSESASVSSSGGMAQLTKEDGSPLLLRSDAVFVIHPSPYHVDGRVLTRLRVLGLGPVDVTESLEQVVGRLRGDWVTFHVPGGPLGLPGNVVAFVSPSHITMMQPSIYRMSESGSPMTDLIFSNGTKFRVVEDPTRAAGILQGA